MNILCHPTQQEIDTVFQNAKVFLHNLRNSTTSYCVLVHREEYQQVMDVFTFPKFRGHEYGKELLRTVLGATKQPTYLICRSELESYYEGVGFEQTKNPPAYLQERLRRVNAISGRFLKRMYLAMVRANQDESCP